MNAVETFKQISCSFYCVTRMHSADYAVAKCLSVCLSVRHTPVFCLNTYDGRPIIIVYDLSDGAIFSDLKRPSQGLMLNISETIRDTDLVPNVPTSYYSLWHYNCLWSL